MKRPLAERKKIIMTRDCDYCGAKAGKACTPKTQPWNYGRGHTPSGYIHQARLP